MHHDSDGGAGDRRFRLKARHVILGALALLLVGAIVHVGLVSSGATRRLEALRAAGYPTSLAEYALQNKLPMGMDNAAPVYESAFAAYVAPAADVNLPWVGQKATTVARGAALSEPMAKAVADYLAANEKCLALLHDAADIENCRYDYDYHQGCPHLSKLRSCVLLLKLAIFHHAGKGDADAVATCVKDALRAGDSMQKEPTLISYLIHTACTGVAITGLEHALNLTTFSDSQLRDLDDALVITGTRTDLAHALITERCAAIDMIQNPSLMGMGGPGPGTTPLKLPGIRSRGIIDMLDYMGASIEAATLEPQAREKRFRQLEADVNRLSWLHFMVKQLAPATLRISQLDSRGRAHLDLARTALAIERYRLATGSIPGQLADLVPKYLEQIPIDPFDGQPIRYRRTEPGYLLYSVTDDGKDNGGKERDDVAKGEPYDLCFIVKR
jgi:hypothetical protein